MPAHDKNGLKVDMTQPQSDALTLYQTEPSSPSSTMTWLVQRSCDSPHGNEPGGVGAVELGQVIDQPLVLSAVLAIVHVRPEHHNMGWSHVKAASRGVDVSSPRCR